MGKTVVVILPILFLGLLFGCSSSTESPPTNVSLKMLLPKLDSYGFETQGVNELDKEELSKGMKGQRPVGMAIGAYEKGNRMISIIIQKYKNKRVAVKEVKRRVENSKIMQSIFQRGNSSPGFKLKEVRVSGHSAYCQIFSGMPDQKYQTRLFWANGLYVFEVICYGEGSWSEGETIKIAGEIGY